MDDSDGDAMDIDRERICCPSDESAGDSFYVLFHPPAPPLAQREQQHEHQDDNDKAFIEVLPDEILGHIMSFVPCAHLAARASLVSHRWRVVALDPSAVGRVSCCYKCHLCQQMPCACEPIPSSNGQQQQGRVRFQQQRNTIKRTGRTRMAARAGHLDCLVYARAQGHPWASRTVKDAAKYGHLGCLEYARSHGCPWYGSVLRAAAARGHLDIVEYVLRSGCVRDRHATTEAARHGHLACLRAMRQHGCKWSWATSRAAAAHGHLHILRYLIDCGHACGMGALYETIVHGHGECMRLVHAHLHSSIQAGSFVWDMSCMRAAAARCDVAALEYIALHGGTFDESVCEALCAHGCSDDGEGDDDDDDDDNGAILCASAPCAMTPGAKEAARSPREKRVNALTFLLDSGCPPCARTCDTIASTGCIDLMKRARSKGAPWSVDTATVAAWNGHLDLLAYLHAEGCVGDAHTSEAAASAGHLECLALLHTQGVLVERQAAYAAAAHGHLACIEYIVSQAGCGADAYMAAWAIVNGHVDCLRFAREAYGGTEPWPDTYLAVLAAGHDQVACLEVVVSEQHPGRWAAAVTDGLAQRLLVTASAFGYVGVLDHIAQHTRGAWHADAATSAATHGRLECLAYLHDRGCPWDERVCIGAVVRGHTGCLKYALDNGCECGMTTCRAALECANAPALRLLMMYGWPGNEAARADAKRILGRGSLASTEPDGGDHSAAVTRPYSADAARLLEAWMTGDSPVPCAPFV